ncbi:PglL family O-oligosaccharyltransferase [Kangiella sediminilitoris]|nr:Wzy polymerase domain-containing protein [Kangiella sediminilitoris]
MKKNKYLTTATLFFTIPILFFDWTEVNTGGGLGFIRNNLAWAVIILLTCKGLLYVLSKRKIVLPKGYHYILFGCLFALFPFLINTSKLPGSTITFLPFALIGCVLAYFALLQIEGWGNKKDKLLLLIVVVALVESIIGFLQLFNSLMMQLTGNIDEYKLIMIDGTFNQRNVFASFISTGLIIGIYIFSRGGSLLNSKIINNLIVSLFIIGSFVIVLTTSRTGVYSLILGVVVMSIAIPVDRKILTKALLPIVISFLLGVAFKSTIFTGNDKGISDTSSRKLIYSTTITAIKESPVLGHGLGSFEKIYLETLAKKLNQRGVSSDDIKRPENLTHPHNEILYWGMQGGVVSIFGLLIIILGFLISIWSAGLRKNLKILSMLIPIGLHLMVELPFYISGVHILLTLFIISYLVKSNGQVRSYKFKILQNRKGNKVFGVFVSVVGFVAITLLLLNSYSLHQVAKFENALNRSELQLSKASVKIGWKDAYDALLLRHRANIAVKQGEEMPIRDYLTWLEKQIKISPRLQYYFNIYYSYQILGNEKKANNVKQQIQYLFVGVKEAEEWLKLQRKVKVAD